METYLKYKVELHHLKPKNKKETLRSSFKRTGDRRDPRSFTSPSHNFPGDPEVYTAVVPPEPQTCFTNVRAISTICRAPERLK